MPIHDWGTIGINEGRDLRRIVYRVWKSARMIANIRSRSSCIQALSQLESMIVQREGRLIAQ